MTPSRWSLCTSGYPRGASLDAQSNWSSCSGQIGCSWMVDSGPWFRSRNCSTIPLIQNSFFHGSDIDGDTLKIFCKSHNACCFVYSDYWPSFTKALGSLKRHVKGYRVVLNSTLTWNELKDGFEFDTHESQVVLDLPNFGFDMKFGLWAILKRDVSLDVGHGPEYLALLFLNV